VWVRGQWHTACSRGLDAQHAPCAVLAGGKGHIVGGGGLPAHGGGAYSLQTAQSLPVARDNVGGGGSCNGSSGAIMFDDDTGVFESGLLDERESVVYWYSI
jgi:hypothetical protein